MSTSRKISNELAAHIVNLYVAGTSANAISVELRIPVTTIKRTLVRAGVEKRPDVRVFLTAPKKAEVAGICAGGASIQEAATLYSISTQTVTRILRQHNVKLPLGRRPSCELDHAAFDEITPDSAYWMGFLFADGCNRSDGNGGGVVATNLGIADRAHVEKLRDFLGSTHSISVSPPKKGRFNSGPSVSFRVRSNRLRAALLARGMVTKRTRVPAPELIASRDFWRGMVDGDGGIGVYRLRHYVYPTVFLTGQAVLLSAFQVFLQQRGLATLRQTPTESGIFRIQTCGSTAFEIIKTLYENTTLALERKHERARLILAGDLDQIRPYE